MTLEECIEKGYTIAFARSWAQEQVKVWNLLQPLEGNRGWDALMAMVAEQAAELADEADAIDLSQQFADREMVRLMTRWKVKTELLSVLRDARQANQDAVRILTQIETQEKEQGNA